MLHKSCHPPLKNHHPAHRKEVADESPIHVPSCPPLLYLIMIFTLPVYTARTQILHSETRPDFPAPNPQGITQTLPAPSASPPHSPPRIAPQSPLHCKSLGCPTQNAVPTPLMPSLLSPRQLLELHLGNERCGKHQSMKGS